MAKAARDRVNRSRGRRPSPLGLHVSGFDARSTCVLVKTHSKPYSEMGSDSSDVGRAWSPSFWSSSLGGVDMRCYRVIRRVPGWSALLLLLALLPTSVSAGPRTAIVGAFDEELSLILEEVEGADVQEVLGIDFTLGRLRGRDVVVVESGVGKVNAAMTTALLLVRFRPEEVIFTGIAGSLVDTVLPGDIVIGLETAQHDLVAISEDSSGAFAARNPATGQRNPIFFPADVELLRLAGVAADAATFERIGTGSHTRTPRVVKGTILTGDAFVASDSKKQQLRQDFSAHAVEMEGAAVAQVCYQNDVPCLVVRSVSDRADATAAEDLERFYRVAARNCAALVIGIVERLHD